MTFLVVLSMKSYPEIVGLIISPKIAFLFSVSEFGTVVVSFG